MRKINYRVDRRTFERALGKVAIIHAIVWSIVILSVLYIAAQLLSSMGLTIIAFVLVVTMIVLIPKGMDIHLERLLRDK